MTKTESLFCRLIFINFSTNFVLCFSHFDPLSPAKMSQRQSFISAEFNRQLNMRKKKTKQKICHEINQVVDDLFTLFTVQFNQKVQEIINKKPANGSNGFGINKSSLDYQNIVNHSVDSILPQMDNDETEDDDVVLIGK